MPQRYNEVPYIKPGVNAQFLLWLTLLGLPALLLFMVYAKNPPHPVRSADDAQSGQQAPLDPSDPRNY